MIIEIHQNAQDGLNVMKEAAEWLIQRKMPLWNAIDFENGSFLKKIGNDNIFTAYIDNIPVAALALTLSDPDLWPDSRNDSCFIHKLSVKRAFSGRGVVNELIEWAKCKTKNYNRLFLRLDCEAGREKLCRLYENLGFTRVNRRIIDVYDIAFYEMKL